MDSFLHWCQHLPLAEAIRNAAWAFPTVEIFHLFGLAMVFGSIFVLNLRLLGAAMKDTPAAEITDDLTPWTLTGLCIQVMTGPLLFITSPARFAGNTFFQYKLLLIALALVYHFAIHRRAAKGMGIIPAKASAILSMLSWIGIVIAGMGIELLA